jgi:hypothetical protein
VSFRLVEYLCPVHGRYEMLVEGFWPDRDRCGTPGCGQEAERVISAPKVKTKFGWATPVHNGMKSEERPPWVKDTRDIARKRGVDV